MSDRDKKKRYHEEVNLQCRELVQLHVYNFVCVFSTLAVEQEVSVTLSQT